MVTRIEFDFHTKATPDQVVGLPPAQVGALACQPLLSRRNDAAAALTEFPCHVEIASSPVVKNLDQPSTDLTRLPINVLE